MEVRNQLYFRLIYPKGKTPWFQPNRRLGGPQGSLKILGKKKLCFSHRESNRVRYADCVNLFSVPTPPAVHAVD